MNKEWSELNKALQTQLKKVPIQKELQPYLTYANN